MTWNDWQSVWKCSGKYTCSSILMCRQRSLRRWQRPACIALLFIVFAVGALVESPSLSKSPSHPIYWLWTKSFCEQILSLPHCGSSHLHYNYGAWSQGPRVFTRGFNQSRNIRAVLVGQRSWLGMRSTEAGEEGVEVARVDGSPCTRLDALTRYSLLPLLLSSLCL